MANNIITNHTLEQYNKKYRNLRHRLLKITKKEVEDFDKKNPTNIKGYLLSGRKWSLIGDTYYEIPKAPRFTWFRNLNAGVQTAVCLLGAGVVATAVTVPLVLLNQNKSSEHIAVIDPDIKDVTCTQKKLDNGALEITLKYDTSKKELDTLDIYMGNEKLVLNTDYTLEGNKIVIAADVLGRNKTKEITIKPILKDKTPEVILVDSVTITNTVTEVEIDEKIELTATVLPENATNKKLTWQVLGGGTGYAEIVEEGGKTYLKGKTAGNISVKATATDGSEKTNSKGFTVAESSYLEYTQVGQTDTCLVKAKVGKTLPENVVIPEKDSKTNRTVVGIAPNGFSGTGLNVKTVTFENPDNITTISSDAFNNNNSLVTFTIPKNVEEIGDRAFKFDPSQAGQTRSLTTITIEAGSKLKKIGNLAFNWQTSLSSITAIPSTVEFIGKDAFWLTGLTSLTFADTTTNWVFNYDEIWTPSTDGSTNATKLKAALGTGYYGVVKNTITISGESSVAPTKTITLSVPDGITVNEWKSSDTSKATVDSSTGVVTGVAAGDCYIYVIAEDGAKVGIKKITVTAGKYIELDKTTLELFNGKEGTINASLSDKGTGEFSFSVTEGTDVISVTQDSSKFTIKALKQGNAKVVISCNGYASASCSVTVEELVKYKIKWDRTINFLSKGEKKLYEHAQTAKKITFSIGETYSVSGENAGESADGDVRASFIGDELKIWSKGLVQFNDNDLINLNGPFYNCTNLETIDLEYIDTSEVTSMNQMFGGDTSLKEIKNISSLKTTACTSMTQMFYDCNQLTSLDLSSFDTSEVENMGLMFGSMTNKMGFTELNLSSFNTSKVNNFIGMFLNCGSLKTIYASSNFVIPNGANSTQMFTSCSTDLKGGKGTTWSSEHVDGVYARIDDPDNSKPGYFTEKK